MVLGAFFCATHIICTSHMKKTAFIYLLSILLISVSAFTADKPRAAKYNSLLWKIEGKNIKTSYLYGTIHMIPASRFNMPVKVQNAMPLAELMMLEIDITDPKVTGEIMKYSQMGDGKKLSDILTEAQMHLIDSVLMADSGINIKSVMRLKPFVIESFLIQKLIEGEAVGIETQLAEMAREQGLPIMSIETVKEQMSIFDSIPYAEQVNDLMRFLNEEEKMRETFAQLVEMYLKEDLSGLDKLMNDYYSDPKLMKHLLYDRNERWLIRLEEQMEIKPVFIAVGAGHLPGNLGLINLLRQWGYKVTPVK